MRSRTRARSHHRALAEARAANDRGSCTPSGALAWQPSRGRWITERELLWTSYLEDPSLELTDVGAAVLDG